MSRNANGMHVTEVREKAKLMFPGKTATIFRLSKAELLQAIETGILPQVNNAQVSAHSVKPNNPAVPSVPVSSVNPRADQSDAVNQLAIALETLTQNYIRPIDSDDVREIVNEMISNANFPAVPSVPSQTISIKINDLPTVSIDQQHERFPILLALCASRVNTMLVGAAGSGKTTAAHEVAKALGLPFYATSCNEQMSPAGLVGFIHANGGYVETDFRKAYEFGGVFLFDEMDRGRPAVLAALNMALANGSMSFADGIVKRHADFICIAGANTFGRGADHQYTTAQALDAATLDRFFTLEWGYDRSLTRALLGLQVTRNYIKPCASGYTLDQWVDRVERIQDVIEAKKIRHLVTPRAALAGAKLLDVIPAALLNEGLIFKGINSAVREQIESEIK